jgi:hypothetical protein
MHVGVESWAKMGNSRLRIAYHDTFMQGTRAPLQYPKLVISLTTWTSRGLGQCTASEATELVDKGCLTP